ncbi:FtsL-like putative cell division protein [Pelobium sp.]|nr:FtsL-like putative cell division protein [Pelobium sp.]MDA9555063.1 FtsL-like putative cell division protein [Pelobium sp.]
MTNRLKTEIEEEEITVQEPVKEEAPTQNSGFLSGLFAKGAVSKETATEALPFVIFLAFLGMIYIGNRHSAENNIRKIDKLGKEVKELSWDFKTLKADLMFKSKQTEVIKRVDSLLGLKVSVKPPIKLKVVKDEH